MSHYNRPRPRGGGYGNSSGGGSGFGRGGGNQEETCNYCREPGHYKRNCPKIAAKERHAQRFSSNAGPSNLNPKSSSSQPPSEPSGKKSDSKSSSTPVLDSEEPPSSSTTTDSPQTVLTNHLSIESLPKQVYVYLLEFIRETNQDTSAPVLITRKFEKQGLFEDDLRQRHECADLQSPRPSNWVTDYNNIWSTRPLFNNAAGPNTEVVNVANLQANDPNSRRRVTAESARITFLKVISPLQTIEQDYRPTDDNESALLQRGLNAMITKHARSSSQPPTPVLIQSGANKFYRRNDHFDLGESQDVRAYHGYFLSTRPGAGQFFLNLNLRCSTFLSDGVILDSLLQMFRDDAQATSTLRGIKVQLLNPGAHPHQGIEFVKSIKSSMRGWDIDVGSASNEVLLDSAGLQTAEHYSYRQALSGTQTSDMIKQALKRPHEHIRRLTTDAVAMFGLDQVAFRTSLLNDFQLAINTDLQSVPCRLLPPPDLRYNLKSNNFNGYGQRNVVNNIESASWNLKGLKLHAKGQTSRVIILDFTSGFKRVFRTRFQKALQSACNRHGFQVTVDGPLSTQASASPSEHEILNEISKRIAKHSKGTEIAFVLGLSRHNFDVYARIKRVAELQLGVKTTCVDAENMEDTKSLDQYCANVVLKLNLKGNGINHTVIRSTFGELYSDTQQKICDTIVIGADVTHPTGHYAPGCPSLAAVVGSVDDDFVKFPGSMRLQRSRKETITELADMVMERLVDWARRHGNRLPGRMLFYRDGVSESQFQSVRDSEIGQLQQAFDMADGVVKGIKNNSQVPFKLTFVVVGKRHNTRFFPEAKIEKGHVSFKTEDKTKNGNVLPGTVVDQVITPPGIDKFYLQSHMPVQGTGKSAHYTVLQNDMDLTSHQLQRITHGFCYIYARATKAVSYCSPAYYADRLCDRGRAYIRDWLIGKKDFGPDRPERKDEKHDDYLDHVVKYLSDDPYYRPDKTTPKYDRPRKNPWHPNLDDIMFYL